MSVCSATAAASSRPGARRESRSSNTRASTSEPNFVIERSGNRIDQRKYSTVSNAKGSSGSNLCCCISILMALTLLCHFTASLDFVG